MRKKSYEFFEKLLENKGVTAYRVAMDLGFSPMALSDWKHGRSQPKLDKMVKIAEYFGVPVESFAYDDE